MNRMIEALLLFERIFNSNYFSDTSVILFLNKRDLLQQKLQRGRSIRVAFPDYPGNDEYEEVVEYIRNAFLMRLNNSRRVYTHVTCATDTENVKFVFEAVADTILRQVLVTAGLL